MTASPRQGNWELAACSQLLHDGEIMPPHSCHDRASISGASIQNLGTTNCAIAPLLKWLCSYQNLITYYNPKINNSLKFGIINIHYRLMR